LEFGFPQKKSFMMTDDLIAGSVTIFILAFFTIVLLVQYQKRKILHNIEKKAILDRYSREILQSQLEIQEQTLNKISQEIHDNIGQVLSLVKLNVGTMDIGQPGQLAEKIEASKKLLAKAIQDLRDLSRSLNTDYVQQMGLARAIEYELELLRKAGDLKVEFLLKGNPFRTDTQKELILFRIVQEVINNVIKHAAASEVIVELEYQPLQLLLTITDNGQGFDLTPLEQKTNPTFGIGIKNMHSRARLIGAEYSISSTPGKGTTVRLLLPEPLNQTSNAGNS
jgi:signal transduction histidine kinase